MYIVATAWSGMEDHPTEGIRKARYTQVLPFRQIRLIYETSQWLGVYADHGGTRLECVLPRNVPSGYTKFVFQNETSAEG